MRHVTNFHEDPVSFSRYMAYGPNCEECPILLCWRILRKIPSSVSRSGRLPKFNHFLSCLQTLLW